MTLSDVSVSTEYEITEIEESPTKRRLLDMGFTPKSKIVVLAVDPFKQTVLVRLGEFEVALRKNATNYISVEAVNDNLCTYRQSKRRQNELI